MSPDVAMGEAPVSLLLLMKSPERDNPEVRLVCLQRGRRGHTHTHTEQMLHTDMMK